MVTKIKRRGLYALPALFALFLTLQSSTDMASALNGISWPDEQILPSFSTPASTLDFIDLSNATNDQQTLFVTLQGLINRTQPRIAVFNPNSGTHYEPRYAWLDSFGLQHQDVVNPWDLIVKYRNEINGIVIYDPVQMDTLNLATTIAGLQNGVVASPALADTLTVSPYNLPVLEDLRGRFSSKVQVYQYAYDHFWSQTTHKILMGLNPNGVYGHLRDYAVAIQAMCVYLDPKVSGEDAVLRKFLSDMPEGSGIYLGWWISEHDGVTRASQYGVSTCASDWSSNLTVFSGTSRVVNIAPVPVTPKLQNKIYVALVLSDGDNFQYDQHYMRLLWDNPDRGSVPIGWTISPALLDVAPAMLNWYHSTSTANDCLISGPSGVGYTYPDQWSYDDFSKFLSISDDYCRRAGLRVVTVWNGVSEGLSQISGTNYAINMPSLVGLTDQSNTGTMTLYDNTMPNDSFKVNYCSSVSDLKSAINDVASGWDGTSPRFVSVQANAWDVGPSELKQIANSLDSSKFIVVRPDHYFQLMRQWNGLGTDAALYKSVTASGYVPGCEPERAVDGTVLRGSKWSCAISGDAWLSVDFGRVINIGKWVVKHAGSGGEPVSYNTSDFELQKSSDGAAWITVDSVSGNVANTTDRMVTPFQSRYVRLRITNGGSDDTARIYAFEVYTVPKTNNVALDQTVSANGFYQAGQEPNKAVDGNMADKWCYVYSGDKWLSVDLGKAFMIDRWIVRHAGSGGEKASYNTKDFKLQKSDNGTTWVDVDAVTGNSANVTDRTVDPFTARYVRLYITNSGSDSAARIYEFEVYSPDTVSNFSNDLAYLSTATANGYIAQESPDKAVDGKLIDNSKWCYSSSGDKWLKLDLGRICSINRWTVRHAGAAGESTTWNTKDFKLQKSDSGETWVDVDAVTGNTANVTDRGVTPFSAQFVRLLITNSGADMAARIYEFEVYGPDTHRVLESEGCLMSHRIGKSDGNGWSASTSPDKAGHLQYGPYVTNIPTGIRTASYRLLIDDNVFDNGNVVRLEVYDATASAILAQENITRQQFTAPHAFQDFNLTFNNAIPGHSLEFRIYWYDIAYILADNVTIQ